jgi:hypothetical protein
MFRPAHCQESFYQTEVLLRFMNYDAYSREWGIAATGQAANLMPHEDARVTEFVAGPMVHLERESTSK